MTTSLRLLAGVALVLCALLLPGCSSTPDRSSRPEPAAPRVVAPAQEVVLVQLTGLT